MAYLALYRKYRPTTFEALIGQDHIVKTLTNQIKSDRLGHAYLFTGTRGTGKTSCAKIFAKAINCLEPVNGSPCGRCSACLALADPSNIDVVEIDAASNNGVNEIRELREKVQYPPVSCRYKVYIIDEVHMLTGAAFNALLKTLEEPPKYAVFILATTEVHKIPATILSRCMRFDFRLISTEKITKLICDIYDEQGKLYDKNAVYAIANAGEGSIRDALSIADIALSFSPNSLTYDDVMEILGSSNFEILLDFVTNLFNNNSGSVLEIIDKLCDLGKSMGVLIKDITAFIRNLTVIKTCSRPNDILLLPQDKFSALKNIADNVTEQRLIRALEVFAEAETALKYTNHPRVVFETAAIKSSRPDADYNIDALMVRMKELEKKLDNSFVKISVKNEVQNQATEEIKPIEEKVSVQDIKVTVNDNEKLSLDGADESEIRGLLLTNLRRDGNEMLWNIMQGITTKLYGGYLIIEVANEGDEDLFMREDTKQKIYNALPNYMPFGIQVKISQKEKNLDKIDQETEKIRRIFGDDIVIVKD